MQPWGGVARWGANGKARMEVQAAAFIAHLSLARADPGEHIIRGLFSCNLRLDRQSEEGDFSLS